MILVPADGDIKRSCWVYFCFKKNLPSFVGTISDLWPFPSTCSCCTWGSHSTVLFIHFTEESNSIHQKMFSHIFLHLQIPGSFVREHMLLCSLGSWIHISLHTLFRPITAWRGQKTPDNITFEPRWCHKPFSCASALQAQGGTNPGAGVPQIRHTMAVDH